MIGSERHRRRPGVLGLLQSVSRPLAAQIGQRVAEVTGFVVGTQDLEEALLPSIQDDLIDDVGGELHAVRDIRVGLDSCHVHRLEKEVEEQLLIDPSLFDAVRHGRNLAQHPVEILPAHEAE